MSVIADRIRSLTPDPDISNVMADVEALLDRSVAAESYIIHEPVEGDRDHIVDLSKIDFERLRARFEKGRRHTEAEKLRGAIERKLRHLVMLNRSRLDYLQKFQQMIDEYNAGSINVELFFDRLVVFAQELNDEEKRSISENLDEEELALFDILTKPEMNLSAKEKTQVKKVARELLTILKEQRLVLDWRKRQQSRAAVIVTIRDVLDEGLPDEFTPEIFQQKCSAVYQHLYDSYFGEGRSRYAAMVH